MWRVESQLVSILHKGTQHGTCRPTHRRHTNIDCASLAPAQINLSKRQQAKVGVQRSHATTNANVNSHQATTGTQKHPAAGRRSSGASATAVSGTAIAATAAAAAAILVAGDAAAAEQQYQHHQQKQIRESGKQATSPASQQPAHQQ